MKRIFFALAFLCSFLPVIAQVSVSGTMVLDNAGNPLSSGQWCFGASCFAVTSGSFSGSVTPGTQTVTVTNGGSTTFLKVAGVAITGAFSWDTFVAPGTANISGLGLPHILCAPGATYTQTNDGTVWKCQNINGAGIWASASNVAPLPFTGTGVTVLQNNPTINNPNLTGICTGPACGSGGGATTPATSALLKGNGAANGVVAATPGTDYVSPSGTVANANAVPASGISGTISASSLPAATASAIGAVKPDNSTITVLGGVISATPNGGGVISAIAGAGGVAASTVIGRDLSGNAVAATPTLFGGYAPFGGIATTTAAPGNSVIVAVSGSSAVTMDGTSIIGDVAVGSVTNPLYCHDSGFSNLNQIPDTTPVCGIILTPSSGAGTTATLQLASPGTLGGSNTCINASAFGSLSALDAGTLIARAFGAGFGMYPKGACVDASGLGATATGNSIIGSNPFRGSGFSTGTPGAWSNYSTDLRFGAQGVDLQTQLVVNQKSRIRGVEEGGGNNNTQLYGDGAFVWAAQGCSITVASGVATVSNCQSFSTQGAETSTTFAAVVNTSGTAVTNASATVTISGTTVTDTGSGDPAFTLLTAGTSVVNTGGANYTVASIASPTSMTLTAAPTAGTGVILNLGPLYNNCPSAAAGGALTASCVAGYISVNGASVESLSVTGANSLTTNISLGTQTGVTLVSAESFAPTIQSNNGNRVYITQPGAAMPVSFGGNTLLGSAQVYSVGTGTGTAASFTFPFTGSATPSGTYNIYIPLIWWGGQTGTSSGIDDGAVIQDMSVNCEDAPDSIGIFGDTLNETSRLVNVYPRQCTYRDVMVHADRGGTPQNWGPDYLANNGISNNAPGANPSTPTTCPAYPNVGIAYEIALNNSPFRGINGSTMRPASTNPCAEGIVISGVSGAVIDNIHAEIQAHAIHLVKPGSVGSENIVVHGLTAGGGTYPYSAGMVGLTDGCGHTVTAAGGSAGLFGATFAVDTGAASSYAVDGMFSGTQYCSIDDAVAGHSVGGSNPFPDNNVSLYRVSGPVGAAVVTIEGSSSHLTPINGGIMPTSAAVLASNASGQPIPATGIATLAGTSGAQTFSANNTFAGQSTFAGGGISLTGTQNVSVGGNITTTFASGSTTNFNSGTNVNFAGTVNCTGTCTGFASGASGAWSGLGAPSANLTLSMAGYTSEFDYTSALAAAWFFNNVTAATSSANQSSPILKLGGQQWNGTISGSDYWGIQTVLGTGSNPTSTLAFTHTGSSGATNITVPNNFTAGGTITASGALVSSNGVVGAYFRSSGTGATLSASGCTVGTVTGGDSAGTFTVSSGGTCTVTVTMAGAAATHGWSCWANDKTSHAPWSETTGDSTTTDVLYGVASTSDVVKFGCEAY